MKAVDLLRQLVIDGIGISARGGRLSIRGRGANLNAATLAELRRHKAELLTLLDGSICRQCRQPIAWRGTNVVTLADGTSLHGECRGSFRQEIQL